MPRETLDVGELDGNAGVGATIPRTATAVVENSKHAHTGILAVAGGFSEGDLK
jgi:hypothetical protein